MPDSAGIIQSFQIVSFYFQGSSLFLTAVAVFHPFTCAPPHLSFHCCDEDPCQLTDSPEQGSVQPCPSFLDSSPPGSVPQARLEKACGKVIENRWKTKGSDGSWARNLAVWSIFSPPQDELVELKVTLCGRSKCLKSSCGLELPCNWILPQDFSLDTWYFVENVLRALLKSGHHKSFLQGEFLIQMELRTGSLAIQGFLPFGSKK